MQSWLLNWVWMMKTFNVVFKLNAQGKQKVVVGAESILFDESSQRYIVYVKTGEGLNGQLPQYKKHEVPHWLVKSISIHRNNADM